MVERDNQNVFMNAAEFADFRTVQYDGEIYEDIPVVLSGLKESDRGAASGDHAEGLYKIISVLNCSLADLGGKQPEKGQKIQINNQEGGGGFFQEFYVVSSICEMGPLTVELEAIDE